MLMMQEERMLAEEVELKEEGAEVVVVGSVWSCSIRPPRLCIDSLSF